MSRLDVASVYAIACRILDHHAAGGTCPKCGPDDCPDTAWALIEVVAHHAARARRVRPGWIAAVVQVLLAGAIAGWLS